MFLQNTLVAGILISSLGDDFLRSFIQFYGKLTRSLLY